MAESANTPRKRARTTELSQDKPMEEFPPKKRRKIDASPDSFDDNELPPASEVTIKTSPKTPRSILDIPSMDDGNDSVSAMSAIGELLPSNHSMRQHRPPSVAGASPAPSASAGESQPPSPANVKKPPAIPNLTWTQEVTPTPLENNNNPLHIPAGAEMPSVKDKLNQVIKKARELYSYDPIQNDESRLLVIKKGAEDDEMNATLLSVPDNLLGTDGLQYGALSYHWGCGEELKPIIMHQDVNAKPIPSVHAAVVAVGSLEGLRAKRLWVKPNLYEALKRLRKQDQDRALWVDALCINQQNIEEKTVQVKKMNQIYRSATNVCVWLGQGDPPSWEAMEFIREFIKLENLGDLVNNKKHIPRWISLCHLLRWSWFSRRWVIQELALAKAATVHCGKYAVHWNDFRDAIGIFTRYFPTLRPRLSDPELSMAPITDLDPLGAKLLVDVSSNIFRRNRDGSYESVLGLEWLVSALSGFASSDPRDAINALRNISKELNSPSKSVNVPVPDYSKDLFEVYRDFLSWVVESSRSLDIICRYWALPERKELGGPAAELAPRIVQLPSWILTADEGSFGLGGNVFKGRRGGESLVGLPGKSHYNASGSKTIEVTFPNKSHSSTAFPPFVVKHDMVLRVKGLHIGTVDGTCPQVVDGIIPEQGLANLGLSRTADSPALDDAPDQLWRTLVADRGPQGTAVPVYYRRACLYCLMNRTENGHININKLLNSKGLKNQQSIVQDYLERVRVVTWNRVILYASPPHPEYCTISPQQGGICETLVGLGPSATLPGDIIAILYGYSVPVVLRGIERELNEPHESYEFIGEAFIYGKMDGEALIDARVEQVFNLR